MTGATAPVLAADVPAIPDVLTSGLGDAGLRFLAEQWAEADWTGADALLLRQSAKALDDSETATSTRERRLATRLFMALVEQLQQRRKQ